MLSYPPKNSPIRISSAKFCKLLTLQSPILRLFLTGPSLQPLVLDPDTYSWMKIKGKRLWNWHALPGSNHPFDILQGWIWFSWMNTDNGRKNSVQDIWSRWCRPQHIPRQSGKPDWTSWHGSSLAGMQLRWFAGQFFSQIYTVTHKSWANAECSQQTLKASLHH